MNYLTNNLDFKRAIASQFDPSTDYSQMDAAEIDGAFEATVYQLLLERAKPPEFKEVALPRAGSTVSWDYSSETAIGKVYKTYTKSVALKIKNSTITRNGTPENPALQIAQDDGSRVLKLASEVQLIEFVEVVEEPPEFRAVIHNVVNWNGLKIGLEYRPGDIRFKGTGYERKLKCGYGHIRGFVGNEGEALDCYLAPTFFNGGNKSDRLFQISQLSPEDSDFDKYKIMIGFNGEAEAKDAFIKEMSSTHFGVIKEISLDDLAQYRKLQPSSEPSFSEEKLAKIITEAFQPLAQRLDRIIEFAEKIQLQGEILPTEEYQAIASTNEATIEKAVKDWQEKLPDDTANIIG